uniref:type II toxin-antitoxin system VapC family toxin n=1 Tax=Candidatus Electronema sp. TaxID=2698783 RepID=UPI00405714B8
MVIDTSALVAILEDEPEASQFSEAIAQARLRLLSAVSLVETSIVIENRRGAAGKLALDVLLEKAEIEIMNVTAEQAEIARQAYRTYGKGQGHPAQSSTTGKAGGLRF